MNAIPVDPKVEAALGEAAAAIAKARNVIVACHIGPDGDALGSIVALAMALGRMGKAVTAGWGSEKVEVPAQYAFLPGTDLLTPPDGFAAADVAVAVDCANAERLGLLRERFESAPVLINVDHHVSNTRFGTIDVVDVESASSAELVLMLLERLGAPIDVDVATCLYTGLVTDTGRFSYASVLPRTHQAAARLIEAGVPVDQVSQAVFESLPYGYLKTLGLVLERCQLDGDLVVSWLTQDDLRATGVSMDETEGVIDVVRAIRESDVACVLKEQDDGRWKVSLRSKGATDVGAVASALGGGGHTLAAGCTLGTDLGEAIGRVREMLRSRDWSTE